MVSGVKSVECSFSLLVEVEYHLKFLVGGDRVWRVLGDRIGSGAFSNATSQLHRVLQTMAAHQNISYFCLVSKRLNDRSNTYADDLLVHFLEVIMDFGSIDRQTAERLSLVAR